MKLWYLQLFLARMSNIKQKFSLSLYLLSNLPFFQFAVEITTNYLVLSGIIFSAGIFPVGKMTFLLPAWAELSVAVRTQRRESDGGNNERPEIFLICWLWIFLIIPEQFSKKKVFRQFMMFIALFLRKNEK